MTNTAPHLRLVVDRSEDVAQLTSKEAVQPPEQLTLPYINNLTAILVNVDRVDRYSFSNMLASVRPKWIFDARATPCLDILGGSRGHAFQLFSQSQAEYIDIFGRLGVLSYQTVDANPAVWLGFLGNLLRDSRERTGAFIVLFDNEVLMSMSQTILPGSLQAIAGVNVTTVRFPY